MDSPGNNMTIREEDHAFGADLLGPTVDTSIHTSPGTVVTTITAVSAAQTPPEVQLPVIHTDVNAPTGPFSVHGVNTSPIRNQNVSSFYRSKNISQEYDHRLMQGQALHSTMILNNISEGSQTTNASHRYYQPQQSQSFFPTGLASSTHSPWQNYAPTFHSTAQRTAGPVPTWSRQMTVPYSNAMSDPYALLFNRTYSNVQKQPSCITMPSPIVTSMTQPSGSMPYTHTNSVPSLLHTNLTSMPTVLPDITLSSSQIASRQVISKELPNFSGRPEDWPLFITNYIQSTERCGFTDQENLLRLQKCLKGDALKAVRGQLMMPNTVSCAIQTLEMLFGRSEVIYQTMQRKLRQEPPVRSDKLETLIQFALSVQNYCATIQAIGLTDYLNDPMLLADLVYKLPSNLKLDWGRYQMAFARVDVGVFDRWLFGLATCASNVAIIGSSTVDNNVEAKNTNKHHRQSILVHEVVEKKTESTQQQILCPQCNENHRLENCNKFCDLSSQDRWKVVREKGLCFRCFKKHQIRRCNSKKQCGVDECKMSHNALLHTNYKAPATQQKGLVSKEGDALLTDDGGVPEVFFHDRDQKKVMFRYVPVTLYGGRKSLDTYALIDEGSACTLIDSSIATELGLDGPIAELCLRWTGDVTKSETKSKVVNLDIASREVNAQRYNLKNVRTVSSLELPLQSLDAAVIKERPHLQNLPIFSYSDEQARILIGLDHAKIGVPLEIRQADDDELVATRCKIGWAIYGRNGGCSTPQNILHICPCSSIEKMDEMLKAYFSLDSIGIQLPPKSLESKEDERARKIMEETSKYLPDKKRWETGLLWKYDSVDLPNSFAMAKRRLQCLESKMKRDPELAKFLIKTIRDYEQKGYVKRLEKEEVFSGGKSWYIPIFTVVNPHKNKKRLVWDAASKVDDVCLNTVLMKGPDLLTSLMGVLIRFRESPVAICGDIKEMFHQVIVRKEDQVAQKFLWREGNSSQDPDTFVMRVLTFGAACSPTLANYIKNKNAYRWEQQHPTEVQAIIKNTYVDDWLQSVKTEEEMIKMATIVRKIHREGGFEMRNWSSNSNRVLAALSGNTSQEDKRIDEFGTVLEKVLGLWWLPQSDEFTFSQKFDKTIFDETLFPTKRQILRIIMSIFDPIGFLGFFVIQAKVILQSIWRSGVAWDEPVLEDERENWWQWVRRLPKIGMIKLPRCYGIVSSYDDVQLHTFVDASINAYAAVSYLRAVSEGKIICSFVASKTRVAPLKPVSVPRLELMAAILGLRLANFIENEMSISLKRRIFWTDSRNVLCWIRSDARKFHQFVALRIGEILEGSNVNEWRWVPSADNVADEGTKPGKNLEFDEQSRWFTGPQFLKSSETDWPELTLCNTEIVHHIDVQNQTIPGLGFITPDPNRFTKWEKLRLAQQYILRFLRQMVKDKATTDLTKFLVNAKTIDCVEAIIIRSSQEDSFAEELACLRSGNRVSHKSSIFRCSPYCDEFGILRVQGRIDLVPGITMTAKRPAIMSRHHPVTRLITDFYHRKFHHHHNEIVVNEMRQRFFVPGLRVLVKTVANTCQLCRNNRVTPIAPSMGSLPMERLSPFTLPFTFTGVDYFGPMDIVIGRRREKRWGVLFTCLTTRAVHLEISPSLSTESFLLVLKQFISRRGVPRRILSDNGTNFRGASRILVTEIEKVSGGKLEQEYPEIEWKFIPPASPHMGGAWERMIRSVKSIMMDILHENALREDVLRATLADIENILNSRPLTYVPLDSPEDAALTPNHFLLGSSSGIRERGSEDGSGSTLRRNFNLTNQLANQFWKRWVREYLPSLTRRTKWFQPPVDPIALNDVVIIVDENSKRNTWRKGIVVDLNRSRDGEARSAVVKTVTGLMTRPIVKLAKLDVKKVMQGTGGMNAVGNAPAQYNNYTSPQDFGNQQYQQYPQQQQQMQQQQQQPPPVSQPSGVGILSGATSLLSGATSAATGGIFGSKPKTDQNVPSGQNMQQQSQGLGGMFGGGNQQQQQQQQNQQNLQQQQQQQSQGPGLMSKLMETAAPGGDMLSKAKDSIFGKFGFGK